MFHDYRLVNESLPDYLPPTMAYFNRARRKILLVLALLSGLAWPTTQSAALAQTSPPPQPQPIMTVDQVRVGMRGYGLTVFHGTKIEPFPVEVVTIMPNSSPEQSTIWIRCNEPRLNVSGPVQGMSGSPIYLWEEGQEGKIGEGGRLIGAFAFGFALVKECLAGVQPIEYMRQTGQRAAEQPADAQAHAISSGVDPAMGLHMLTNLQRYADEHDVPLLTRYPLDQAVALLRHNLGASAANQSSTRSMQSITLDGVTNQPRSLALPMAVGSDALAGCLTPLLEPAGIMPVAGSSLAGQPPMGIDTDIPMQPGGVLSIPLAFGDADLNASGTITDVLPDGTVLGFGHAMFGMGPVAVPMASGYVHFVVPRITTSFKQAGSLKMHGSIVQDEAFAVAGVERQTYTTAPVNITVTLPGQAPHDYEYEVVDHPMLTAPIAVALVGMSLSAVHAPPLKSTARIEGSVSFSGNRTVTLNRRLAGQNAEAVTFELVPLMLTMMMNPFEELKLERMDLAITIDEGIQVADLETVTLRRAVVAPGESVRITLGYRTYGQPVQHQQLAFHIPEDLPDGQYQLMISDATMYAQRLQMTRPYLMQVDSIDDVFETMSQQFRIRRDALYLVLQSTQQSVAVGRQPLPHLPSSKSALLTGLGRTDITQYPRVIEQSVDVPVPVQGELQLTVTVKSPDAPVK